MSARRPFGVSLACALLCAGPLYAQSEDLAGILSGSVVTTASQAAEAASSAPATSSTISSDDLRRYGIHTLEEAINYLSLGVSSAGGRSAASTIDLGARGVFFAGDSGNHFLLLIDGHAVNEPFYGTARFDHTAGIPLEAVDRIEVVVGPGSVLYGSNAMLGVINVITKSGSSSKGGHLVAETELPVYRRAAALAGAEFDLFGANAELTAAAQYWQEYGPTFELGPQNMGIDPITQRPTRTARQGPETGVWGGTADESNFAHVPSGLLRFRIGEFELALRGRIAEWGHPFDEGDFDDPDTYALERSASADLKYRTLLTPKLSFSARLYGDTFDFRDHVNLSRGQGCFHPGATTCTYRTTAASRWAGAEVQATYDWLGDGTLSTLLGVDGRLRFVGSKLDVLDFYTGRYLDDSDGIIDETDGIFGAYVQQTWSPSARVGFNAGARLDRDPRFDAVVSPRAAVSLGVWEGGTWRGIYSEAFRAPTFQETELASIVQAEPDPLDPERVRALETSIEQRFGTQRLFFGVFRSWWKNMVELRYLTYEEAIAAVERGQLLVALPTVSHTQYQNAASVDSYGLNAGLDGTLLQDRLRYGFNVTEAFSRRNDRSGGTETLRVAPRIYGNARVAYDLGGDLPTVALAAYSLSSRVADRGLNAGFRPAPIAPTLVDMRATLTGRIPFVPGMSYRASAAYLAGDSGPYVIGPVTVATANQPSAELVPLQSLRVAVGLQYDFWTE